MRFKLLDNYDILFLQEENWITVEIKACFPLIHEDKYLSVIDKNGSEVMMIDSLSHLLPQEMEVIKKYLVFKEYHFQILGVYDVLEEFAIRSFSVKTNSGDMKFQTELDEWPTSIGDKGYIIQDLFGDRYLLNHLEFGVEKIQALIN